MQLQHILIVSSLQCIKLYCNFKEERAGRSVTRIFLCRITPKTVAIFVHNTTAKRVIKRSIVKEMITAVICHTQRAQEYFISMATACIMVGRNRAESVCIHSNPQVAARPPLVRPLTRPGCTALEPNATALVGCSTRFKTRMWCSVRKVEVVHPKGCSIPFRYRFLLPLASYNITQA